MKNRAAMFTTHWIKEMVESHVERTGPRRLEM
jgi:hypothetical protein